MKQGTSLTARQDFAFKPEKKGGRRVTVRTGARFWCVTPEYMQAKYGVIHVARHSQPMHYDYAFSPDQIAELFEVQP